MQLDGLMLDQAVQGAAAFRFYRWDEPTVSLGHFQAVANEPVPARFAGLPVVPRLSGGGAILHDQELTYSIALPASHALSTNPSQLYDIVHEALIAGLAEQGVVCQMRGAAAFADASFLCFSRGDARDIVIGQQKIVGSAQRRRRGAILQHGSLLLRQSTYAPEFPGVEELCGVIVNCDSLIARVAHDTLKRLELVQVN